MVLRPQSGGCACTYETGWLCPVRMARRVQTGRREEVKGRNTAAYGHSTSLVGAFLSTLGISVDEAGSEFWRSRARWLVDSAARRWLSGGETAE